MSRVTIGKHGPLRTLTPIPHLGQWLSVKVHPATRWWRSVDIWPMPQSARPTFGWWRKTYWPTCWTWLIRRWPGSGDAHNSGRRWHWVIHAPRWVVVGHGIRLTYSRRHHNIAQWRETCPIDWSSWRRGSLPEDQRLID